MKGEPSAATATTLSDCQASGDDRGFHQVQRDRSGDGGDGAEIDVDDSNSGCHAAGLRSGMEHTGGEKTESEVLMNRAHIHAHDYVEPLC